MPYRLLNVGVALTRTALHLTLTACAAWREWSAEYDRMRRQQAFERAAVRLAVSLDGREIARRR